MKKLLLTLPVALAVLALGTWVYARLAGPRQAPSPMAVIRPEFASYEQWAWAQFTRKHPGEKPLNWAIAEAAVQFHRAKPMGKFVLGLEPGEWGNDCSDFVDCAVDEGLGVKARFKRDSKRHLLANDPRLFDCFYWRHDRDVQQGDIISVCHSPWYEPQDGSCWHVGIIGSDGMVYDFVKLKSWKKARYGRHEFEWFVRHSLGPRQVIVWRPAAKYRYKIAPVPEPPDSAK